MMPSAGTPPHNWLMRYVALFSAMGASSCRISRSKRYEASVLSPRELLVALVLAALKLAASKNMSVVPSSISVFMPPIIPARPIDLEVSAITSIGGIRVLR